MEEKQGAIAGSSATTTTCAATARLSCKRKHKDKSCKKQGRSWRHIAKYISTSDLDEDDKMSYIETNYVKVYKEVRKLRVINNQLLSQQSTAVQNEKDQIQRELTKSIVEKAESEHLDQNRDLKEEIPAGIKEDEKLADSLGHLYNEMLKREKDIAKMELDFKRERDRFNEERALTEEQLKNSVIGCCVLLQAVRQQQNETRELENIIINALDEVKEETKSLDLYVESVNSKVNKLNQLFLQVQEEHKHFSNLLKQVEIEPPSEEEESDSQKEFDAEMTRKKKISQYEKSQISVEDEEKVLETENSSQANPETAESDQESFLATEDVLPEN